MKLEELDEKWVGKNPEKTWLKFLCRKYSPNTVMEWIHRGIVSSQRLKPRVMEWHKQQVEALGVPIEVEQPQVDVYEEMQNMIQQEEIQAKQSTDSSVFVEDTGDYFSDLD